MPRTFWKGAISFGMVTIPVRMSTAIDVKTPIFSFLHEKCQTRPKQVLYCEKDDEYLTRGETVKGYEYAKDRFVVLNDEDFEKVPVKTLHTIDILGFSRIDEIDIIYYDGTHYLEPEAMGLKPFILLRNVLDKKGLSAIAKVAFARREHLCCLRPYNSILALHRLHYQASILSPNDMKPDEVELKDAEMEMAEKLVDAMTIGFKPNEYHDDYTAALLKLIEAKLQGIELQAPEIPQAEIEDLMEALRQSVTAAVKH